MPVAHTIPSPDRHTETSSFQHELDMGLDITAAAQHLLHDDSLSLYHKCRKIPNLSVAIFLHLSCAICYLNTELRLVSGRCYSCRSAPARKSTEVKVCNS